MLWLLASAVVLGVVVGAVAARVGRAHRRALALASPPPAERERERTPGDPWGEALIDEAPVGLVVVDAGCHVRAMNATARAWLGTRGDPLGRTPIDSTPCPELHDALAMAVAGGAAGERVATAGSREVLVRAQPLASGQGGLAVLLDATPARNTERARRDFVANVSHELRTPATALIGFAELLADERDVVPPGLASAVDAILRNTRRILALVDDVLQLSKIEARRSELALTRQPLAPLVESVAERLRGAASTRGVSLAVEVPEVIEARVNAEGFEHALGNLVDNAIKYTPRGGHVRVVASGEAGTVRVGVVDDGVGIDTVHHARIFERFYRADAARCHDVGGTGLGLAIVKHLCAAMSAEVSFTSVPGQGSCFTLRFPG